MQPFVSLITLVSSVNRRFTFLTATMCFALLRGYHISRMYFAWPRGSLYVILNCIRFLVSCQGVFGVANSVAVFPVAFKRFRRSTHKPDLIGAHRTVTALFFLVATAGPTGLPAPVASHEAAIPLEAHERKTEGDRFNYHYNLSFQIRKATCTHR